MQRTLSTNRSELVSLYEEMATNKPGRMSSKVNVEMSKTPMPATGYIRLCLSTNLPPTSARGIQDASLETIYFLVN